MPASKAAQAADTACDQRSFSGWMRQVQERMEEALSDALPSSDAIPSRLHEAMRYASLNGGKRIRPLLAFAAGELTGAAADKLAIASCAVEMIHAYSLVHDDLPAMDNDVLRRGQPTCHIQYDEPTALLVGDALQSLAFELLAREPLSTPARQLEMVRLLAQASGSQGMAGGQAIDLAAVGKTLTQPELERMHALKTGALIRASVMLGALCGKDVDERTHLALEQYAQHAGLLFQVVDDILDCTASTDQLGKTAGKDAVAEKPTYVSLLGLDLARRYAQELKSGAIASLAGFGTRAQRLVDLINFFADRQF